ncbi:MAG TPA: LEA type 2 family protein [Thermoanaerobaculia bacterium]
MKRNLIQAAMLTGLCVVLAAVTLFLSGCSQVASALNIQNPHYSFRDVQPRVNIALPLSASTIDFDMIVAVDNPNSVGLRLDRFDFSLFVNDSRLLDSVTDERINIPARGIGDVHLRARVGYNNIRNLWQEVVGVINGNRARYEVRGTAYYNTPVGQLRFPVTVYTSSR